MARKHKLLLLFFFTIAIVFPSQVCGHGFMATPRTRGAYCNDKVGPDVPIPQGCVQSARDFCAHCQNGGGVGAVRRNLNNRFTRYRSDDRVHAGLCGDPIGNNDHMIGGKYVPFKEAPIVAGYEPDSVVDFAVQIDTNHNGYFSFYLCNLDACDTDDLEQKCFKEHCQQLERVPNAQCENPGAAENAECGPIDKDQPGRWYVPCRGKGKVKGGGKGTMKYRIPSNVNCKHCVVQMYWVTANSCNPSNIKEYFESKPFGNSCSGDGGSIGGINPTLRDCGGDVFPEEFWGCADVAVHNGASKKTLAQLQLDGSKGEDSSNGSDSMPDSTVEDRSTSDDPNIPAQNEQNQTQADDKQTDKKVIDNSKDNAQSKAKTNEEQKKDEAQKRADEKIKAEAQKRADEKKKAEAQKRADDKKKAETQKRAEERKKAEQKARQKSKQDANKSASKSNQPSGKSQTRSTKSSNKSEKKKNQRPTKSKGKKYRYKVYWVRDRDGRRHRKVVYYVYRRGRFVKQRSFS